MKTHRVILTASEVSHALTQFAYEKLERRECVQTGAVQVMVVMGDDGAGGQCITQARVEMDLPE